MIFDEDESAIFENEKIFIEFFINVFSDFTARHMREQTSSPGAFSSLGPVEEKATNKEEEEKAQIQTICKHLRKQAKVNRKTEKLMKKTKSKAIKRVIRKAAKLQVNSVSCLPDYTPTEASILVDADEDGIVDEVKNVAVEIAENIVASSTSHFVLFSLSIIGESMNINFNIMEIDCCVRESASPCFFVFLASSTIDIDVSMNANLNIMTDDYCVRKPVSSCYFVILTSLVIDTTSSFGPAENVISISSIMHLNFTASSFYYFFDEVRSI